MKNLLKDEGFWVYIILIILGILVIYNMPRSKEKEKNWLAEPSDELMDFKTK